MLSFKKTFVMLSHTWYLSPISPLGSVEQKYVLWRNFRFLYMAYVKKFLHICYVETFENSSYGCHYTTCGEISYFTRTQMCRNLEFTLFCCKISFIGISTVLLHFCVLTWKLCIWRETNANYISGVCCQCTGSISIVPIYTTNTTSIP